MIHACTMTSTSSPYRIIAVCTGNICRSPMAELMLAEAIAAAGLAGAVVDSAGTTAYEVGRPIDPRAARKLTAHSIASDRHVAREWRAEWFETRDLILALDVDHFGWLQQAAPDPESLSKIRMLRSFDPAVAMFRRGLWVNLLNPKAIVFFLAFMPQFIRPEAPLLPQYLALSATVIVIDILVMWFFFAAAAKSFQRFTHDARGQLILNRTFGVLFMAVGVMLALIH